MPERVSAPVLVMWSVPELPLSVVSATPGAARRRCVQREAEAGGRGHVAGHVGLANRNGVEALNRCERVGPGLAVVDRVLNECAGLDAGEGQRTGIGDVVGPGAAAVGRRAPPGAVGAVVSSVKLKLVAVDTLPATSVWRT